MPFKMKGFPMMKGTGAMKAMKESAMKKMHASPKKAMKDPMKKMKDPMKAMKDPMKAMKDPMKAMHASPKKAMHASPKKAMSPKKKMTGGDTKKKPMNTRQDSVRATIFQNNPNLHNEIPNTSKGRMLYNSLKKANKKIGPLDQKTRDRIVKEESPKKAMKESPKKAMSPKKKTIAKDKDPKFKKSNRRSQAEFEPMYEGADISRAQFNKMSKREQRKYVKTQTD